MAETVQKGGAPHRETKSSSQILDEIFKQLEEVSAKGGSAFLAADLTTVLAGAPRSSVGIRPATDSTKPEQTRKDAAAAAATTAKSNNQEKTSSNDRKSRHKRRHKHKHKKSKKHKSRSHSQRSSSHSDGDDDKRCRRSRSSSAPRHRPVSPSKDDRGSVVIEIEAKREAVVSVLQLIPRSVQVSTSLADNKATEACLQLAGTNDAAVSNLVPIDETAAAPPDNMNNDAMDASLPDEEPDADGNSVEGEEAENDDIVGVGQEYAEDVEDNEENGEDNEENGEDNVENDEDNVENAEDNVENDEDNVENDEDNVENDEDNVENGEDNEDEIEYADEEETAVADEEEVSNDVEVAESAEEGEAESAAGEEVDMAEEEEELEEEDGGAEIELTEDSSKAASGDEEDDELSHSSTGADQMAPSISNQTDEQTDVNEGEQSDGGESTKTDSEDGQEACESGDELEVGEEESVEIQDGDSGSSIQVEQSADANIADDATAADPLSPPAAFKKEPTEGTVEGPRLASAMKIENAKDGGSKKEVSGSNSGKTSKSKLKKKSKHSSKRKSVRSKVTVINNAVTGSSATAKSIASSRKRKSSKVSGSSSKRHKSRDKKPRSSKTKPISSTLSRAKSRSPPRKDSRRRSRSQSIESRSRRSRRSRSRSPISTVRSRARRSASRDTFRRNRRSRTRSKGRSRSPMMEKIDKVKLLEIARKNALAMMAAGQLPKNLTVSVQKLKEEVVVPIKAGGKSVEELTDFCKVLSKKEMEEGECSDYDSNGTIHSGVEDDEDDTKKTKKKDEPAQFLHHPFKLREQPASIIVNIRNAIQIPTRTPAEKVAEGAKLRIQFPVSSGTQHRQKESEWVPVSPKKDGAEVAKSSDTGKTSPKISTCTTVATLEEKVFAEIEEPPVPVLDIGAIVSQRLKAVRQLMDNPENTEAQGQMHRSQQQMQYWAQSKQLPGQFTGSTDAQILTPQQLAGPSCQAWVRKDQFTNAAPVQSGFGLHILQKMGWKPGEGLGKNGDGTALPLLLDIKLDKKGLVTAGEIPRGCRRPPIPLPVQQQQQQLQQPVVRDLSGKHPVSALVELCNKRRWLPPEFVLVSDFGPDHQKNFLFKVRVHNVDYQPNVASPNKKLAKAQSATVCLQALGLFPRNPNQPL